MTVLNKLQREQIERICTILLNMGCKYAIVTPDGVQFGDLGVNAKKQRTRQLRYGKFELRDYIVPHLEGLQPGQVGVVPVSKYDPTHVQSYVTSYAARTWGNGTYTSTINKEDQTVEILLTGGI